MRGHIVGLLSQRSSILPILTQPFPAQQPSFLRLQRSHPPHLPDASDVSPPIQKRSSEQGFPWDRPSLAAPGPSNPRISVQLGPLRGLHIVIADFHSRLPRPTVHPVL